MSMESRGFAIGPGQAGNGGSVPEVDTSGARQGSDQGVKTTDQESKSHKGYYSRIYLEYEKTLR